MSNIFVKRLTKEIANFTSNPPPNLILIPGEDLSQCLIHITGAKDTLYEDEKYTLQFKFDQSYPLEVINAPSNFSLAPEVVFIGSSIPVHPHVYSNGHICLSILYDQW